MSSRREITRWLIATPVAGLLASGCRPAQSAAPPALVVQRETPTDLRIAPGRTRFVDLGALLRDAPDNAMTVQVRGPVAMRVWPFQDQAEGPPAVWYKRELLDHLTATADQAAAGAAGEWLISYRSGPGETGEPATIRIRFSVAEPASPLIYSIGQRTPAGFGGFPLASLPGTAADKSVSGQSQAGAFAINTDTAHLAWAGIYGSPVRLVGTPKVGQAVYWVDVADAKLKRTWRIVFDVRPDELNAAPNPGQDAPGRNQLATLLTGRLHFGDIVLLEDGEYPRIGQIKPETPTVNPATRQDPPISPYVEGWSPHGIVSPDPGWITIRSRNPLGAAVGPRTTGNVNSASGAGGVIDGARLRDGAFYWRFSNLRNGSIFPMRTGPEKGFSWLMFDHNTPGRITANAGEGESSAIFLIDNYVDAGGLRELGGLSVVGRDCQIVGNWIQGSFEDSINPAIYNGEPGSGRSVVAWNFMYNKNTTAKAHPDYVQQHFHAVKAYQALPPGAVVELPDFIGNLMIRGRGYALQESDVGVLWPGGVVTPDDVGKAVEDAHGLFLNSTTRKDLLHRMRISGNVQVSLSFHGIETPHLADGSVISHNLVVYDYGVLRGAQSRQGYAAAGPWAPGKGTGAPFMNTVAGTPGPGVLISHNLMTNGGFAAAGPTRIGNLLQAVSISSPKAAADYWVNPFLGDGAQSVRAVVEAWQPKPGSPARKSDKVVGPFGDTSIIDFRRRTFDPDKLFS